MTIAIQSKKDLPLDNKELRDFSWDLILKFHKLQDQYNLLCKSHFGKSSEKMVTDSIQIELDSLLSQLEQDTTSDAEEEFVVVPSHKRRVNHPGRNVIPEDIPTKVIILDIPEEEKTCDNCKNDKYVLDYKEHIVIDRIPAKYEKIVYKRPIYVCKCKDTVTIAEPVSLPIPKGLASVNLLVFVILSKYLYHLPLYRIQRQIYHESRIWFTRSTMVCWIKKICLLLEVLYDELLIEYQKSTIRHADESRIPVQGDGKVSNHWMWVGVNSKSSENHVVIFKYNKSRDSKAASDLLGEINNGYLMIDAFASYEKPIAVNKLKTLLCMAHVRRQFKNTLDCGIKEKYNRWIIRKIGQLYKIEGIAKKKDDTAKTRYELRQRFSKRILFEIKKKLENPGFVILPGNRMTNAINYMLGNWERVVLYLDNGNLPIDNNLVEQTIRTLAIGRNNWKKVGSANGAKWTAILYSLIATCKINHIDPHKYFFDILQRLPLRAAGQSVKDLIPTQWVKQKDKSVDITDYPKS